MMYCKAASRPLIMLLLRQSNMVFTSTTPRESPVSEPTGPIVGSVITCVKHCECDSKLPDCCDDGWQVTPAGSRFLMGSEERYGSIKGEALGLAWALEQTKYFSLGCENLTVATDHKPLVGIFNDKELRNISNSRNFRLKQRTLWWFLI